MNKTTLLTAGLPVVSCEQNRFGNYDTVFERELTPDEWERYVSLSDEGGKTVEDELAELKNRVTDLEKKVEAKKND